MDDPQELALLGSSRLLGFCPGECVVGCREGVQAGAARAWAAVVEKSDLEVELSLDAAVGLVAGVAPPPNVNVPDDFTATSWKPRSPSHATVSAASPVRAANTRCRYWTRARSKSSVGGRPDRVSVFRPEVARASESRFSCSFQVDFNTGTGTKANATGTTALRTLTC